MSGNGEMSNPKLRLIVVFGGRSAEHDISCVTARHVLAAVDPERYDIVPIGIDRDGKWSIAESAAQALVAGADLTAETFAGALDSFGAQPLAGYPITSLSSSKTDARDSLSLAQWNGETSAWTSLTDTVNFG